MFNQFGLERRLGAMSALPLVLRSWYTRQRVDSSIIQSFNDASQGAPLVRFEFGVIVVTASDDIGIRYASVR